MPITWTDEQRRAIEGIVSARLATEHRIHRREWAAREGVLRSEIARLEQDLRAERAVVARIRDWLSDVFTAAN